MWQHPGFVSRVHSQHRDSLRNLLVRATLSVVIKMSFVTKATITIPGNSAKTLKSTGSSPLEAVEGVRVQVNQELTQMIGASGGQPEANKRRKAENNEEDESEDDA